MARIGIIGGGQLAAMLVQACQQINAEQGTDHHINVLAPSSTCPAVKAGGTHVPGVPETGEGFAALAADSEVITLDLENVSIAGLRALADKGVTVIPDPELLARLTDKLSQKRWLLELGLPTAEFLPFDAESDVNSEPFGFPVVQKAARGGYDGRGVVVLHSAADNANRLHAPGYLEVFIERKMELSVMVAADADGDIRAYSPVEMVFHEGGNVLDYLVAPARLEESLCQQAQSLASKAIASMGATGIFGIEMFLTNDEALLINEISPRTHNSGHFSAEACRTSQFAQQLRILTGQALGSTEQLTPAVMYNLLGMPGFEGETIVERDDEAGLLESEQVTLHLYGKKHCFPGRKMGHVTILAESATEALATMAQIRHSIRVRGAQSID